MLMPDESLLQEDAFHWLLVPAVQLFGGPAVYQIGFNALGYPPTWADMPEEVELIESALLAFAQEKINGTV